MLPFPARRDKGGGGGGEGKRGGERRGTGELAYFIGMFRTEHKKCQVGMAHMAPHCISINLPLSFICGVVSHGSCFKTIAL